MAEPAVAQQQASNGAPPAGLQAGADKPGLAALQALAKQQGGTPAPESAAFLMQQNPADKDAMVVFLNQTYGNAYAQQVLVAAQKPISAADAQKASAITTGTGGAKGGQPAKVDIKDPAAKLGTQSQGEYDQQNAAAPGVAADAAKAKASAAQGDLPAPPAFVYNDGDPRDGKQRIVDKAGADAAAKVQANAPQAVAPADGTGRVAPDGAKQVGDLRVVNRADTTNTGGVTTDTTTARVTANAPQNSDQQVAAYKKSASTAIDDQITALTKPGIFTKQPQELVDAKTQLEDAKKKLGEAKSVADVDAIVKANKLPVAPPDNTVTAGQSTSVNEKNPASGVLYGTPIVQRETKDATQTFNPDGSVVTKTDSSTNNWGTKGIDKTDSHTVATQNADGTARVDTNKSGVTGGITDPLKYNASSTTTRKDADGNTRTNNVNGGAVAADGFGGGQLGGSTVNKNGQGASASASGGIVNNDQGVGLKGGVDDARIDAGNIKGKPVTGGIYGSFDKSMQFLVTPLADGGVTITMTAQGHAKVGAFLGKRDPKDPVESGGEVHGGAAIGKTFGGTVTKSRTYSAADAQKILGNLDTIANSGSGTTRTFGSAAAIDAACQAVFGQGFGPLCGDAMPVEGETDTRVKEDGWAADAKAGGSGGDDAKSRTGGDVNANYSNTDIKGGEDSLSKGVYTRKILTGNRESYGGGGSISEGPAGGGMSGQHTDQKLHTYIFMVPAGDGAELVAARKELHAMKDGDETAAKAYATAHPDYYKGVIDGDKTADEVKGNANVGPLGVKGGTTETVDTNVLKGQHVVVGPDGQKHIVKDLSGTAEGTQSNDSSVSLLGVDLAKGNSTTAAKGTVDPNGQSSLDVNTSTTDSNLIGSKAKNKTDVADGAVAVVTGGPMGLVKRLAERVGETNTVGAHFDDASFNQLVGCAQDQHRWANAVGASCAQEWAQLRNQLNSPNPPADWIAQDESEGHVAAKQLARMKSIAKFIASAGKDGQDCISRVRGEYGADAIGQTVSFPPSLQPDKPVFDDLCKQLEHLKQTLDQFAEAGDEAGGNALLDKLDAGFKDMRDKIANAKDHSDPTLGVRAANGIGDQQQQVAAYRQRFQAAIAAKKANKPSADIQAALEQPKSKATELWKKQDGDQKQVVQAKAAAKKSEDDKPADNASPEEWAAWNKKYAQNVGTEMKADQQAKDDKTAENAARDAEQKSAAESKIPDFEQRCVTDKGKAWDRLDQAFYAAPQHWYSGGADAVFNKLMELQTLMNQWVQDWDSLKGYYKDAGRDPGQRDDIRPGLISSKLQAIRNNGEIPDNTKGAAEHIQNLWGRL
ncbi:MAG TPA: hypothetical protein VGM88_08315 [Kofleriaceae bacterium]